MPVLGLGTWELTGNTCYNAVKIALKLGYTHIDTAEIYGNQSEIGNAISNFNRNNLFITSKVWYDNLHYNDVLIACEKTLEDLGIDYLDLYLIHWPNRNIPMRETFDALKELYDKGKVKSIGVSNFTIRHLKEALKISNLISVNQVEFHPFLYQKELLFFCEKHNIKIIAYSPLARTEVFSDKTIKTIANKYNKTPAQISLRWLLQKGIVVIPKASSKKHLKENLNVFDFEVSNEDMRKIDSIKTQKRLVNPDFTEFD
jgi:diketogulonate reductase-like aldo/keto reductase